MKVIRYKKDNFEQYFDYDYIIDMLKQNNGRIVFKVFVTIPIEDKLCPFKVETIDIEITAEKLLLDDSFEIRYLPFTFNECLQLILKNMNHDTSLKLEDYMREIKAIELKTERKM